MTIWSDVDIARLWIGAGGTSEGAILQWVVCVGEAESGGDDHAVSPDGALGLFQIMPMHYGQGGIGPGNWANPTVNCRAAIVISNNGQNWAPWASCYVDSNNPPYVDYLHTPEQGSPAYMRIWQVQNDLARAGELTGTTTTGGPSSTSGRATLGAAWGYVQGFMSGKAPAQFQVMDGVRRAIDRSQSHRL